MLNNVPNFSSLYKNIISYKIFLFNVKFDYPTYIYTGFYEQKSLAKSLTDLGHVAEKNTVYLSNLIYPTISLT